MEASRDARMESPGRGDESQHTASQSGQCTDEDTASQGGGAPGDGDQPPEMRQHRFAGRLPTGFSGILESPVFLPMMQVRGTAAGRVARGTAGKRAKPRPPMALQQPFQRALAPQTVEPSPSTSLLAFHPMPLFHAGARAAGSASGAGADPVAASPAAPFPYPYPHNFIAPSRNRQVRSLDLLRAPARVRSAAGGSGGASGACRAACRPARAGRCARPGAITI
jgi:hypothetical protein